MDQAEGSPVWDQELPGHPGMLFPSMAHPRRVPGGGGWEAVPTHSPHQSLSGFLP